MPQLNLPLNPNEVWNAVKAGSALADTPVELLVAGSPENAGVAGQKLAAQDTDVQSFVNISGEIPSTAGPDTVVLALVSMQEDEPLRPSLARVQWPAGGVVVVLGDHRQGPGITWFADRVARVGIREGESWERVWEALVWAAGGRAVPLARRFPVLREAAARRLIANTCLQNAAVGAVLFVPGTDLAVMTLNQMRLILNIAGLYGHEVGKDRLLELASVLGAGLGFRAVARQAVGLVPGLGWAVKGGMGYAGTKAVGEAALRYFQHGAPLAVHTLQGRATALVRRLRS